MAKTKFPRVIHVAWEENVGSNENPYLTVFMDGVMGVEDTQTMAVYQLVKVGKAVVTREFKDK